MELYCGDYAISEVIDCCNEVHCDTCVLHDICKVIAFVNHIKEYKHDS